jgi:hypothetical protein
MKNYLIIRNKIIFKERHHIDSNYYNIRISTMFAKKVQDILAVQPSTQYLKIKNNYKTYSQLNFNNLTKTNYRF